MAYTNYDFYRTKYYGVDLEPNSADRWFDMASDELDAFTFGRLASAFPESELHADKVRKAVCAIADALFNIDEQRRAASAQRTEDGSYRGAVASISSGRESISFSSAGTSASSYAAAAASEAERAKLIGGIVAKYLANVPDANGVNLLYAGVE